MDGRLPLYASICSYQEAGGKKNTKTQGDRRIKEKERKLRRAEYLRRKWQEGGGRGRGTRGGGGRKEERPSVSNSLNKPQEGERRNTLGRSS